MDIKSFRKPEQLQPDTQTLATAVDEYLQQLSPNPFLVGQHIRRLTLTSAGLQVPHKLNSVPRGWVITRIDGAQTVYEASTTPFTNRFVHLAASGTCIVDIWIF